MLRTTRFRTGSTLLALAISAISAVHAGQNTTENAESVGPPSTAATAPPEVAKNSPSAAIPDRELDHLVLENQTRDEALRQQLAPMTAELQKLKLENDLARARAEKESQGRRASIEQARMEADEITARVALEAAKLQESSQVEMVTLRAARDRANLEADVAQAKFAEQSSAFKAQELAWTTRLTELSAKIGEREKELEADGYVEEKTAYVKDPLLADGTLLISDRRIPLNGVITSDTADAVCSRIDFLNNKSKEFPIFIVIDDSPGGSVMAGSRILKTMQSSPAPVYVVVKSFAASMAATICTLAPHSFAYPNAIILHHQISNEAHGNLTSQRENVKLLGEWWRRLATPIAAKMGISVDEFCERMYTHSASGDWQEFADEAKKLKWVDAVIGTCRETALVKAPAGGPSGDWYTASAAHAEAHATPHEEQGKAHPAINLPRLNPADCYFLYNPDGFYRLE